MIRNGTKGSLVYPAESDLCRYVLGGLCERIPCQAIQDQLNGHIAVSAEIPNAGQKTLVVPAQWFRSENWPTIRVYESDGATLVCETDWTEFCWQNRDGFDESELDEHKAELQRCGRTWIGGGAAPQFLIMTTLPR
jgi:hypothetical protein